MYMVAQTRPGRQPGDIVSTGDESVQPNEASQVPVADFDVESISQDAFIAASDAKPAPDLAEGQWINSEPIKLGDLHGRVVLVDFWTFGCFNCRNTLPTLKRLDAEYRDKGLRIIGVHTPESGYERKFENVKAAVAKYGIEYPVVTDVEEKTWDAFGVNAWPTVIIIDKQGRIRFKHIGEGAYDKQEQVIKVLLSE